MNISDEIVVLTKFIFNEIKWYTTASHFVLPNVLRFLFKIFISIHVSQSYN